MKNILELKASKKLGADHIIRAVLLDVGSPPPSEPEKQPIVLCLPPGDIKMGCNIIGKHLHIDPAEKGRVIWITSKKDGACYVSYFDDEKKHFLTIRDGVHFDFRDLDPKVKMNNPKDRLPYLADHYRACYEEAARSMKGIVDDQEFLTPIATALWIETKAGVVIPVTPSEPKSGYADVISDGGLDPRNADKPAPKADPPPGKPPEELPEVKEVHIKAAYEEYSKMDYSKICELAASALTYSGKNGVALAKREALIKLLDELAASKEPKAWFDVYDSVWQPASEDVQKILDDGIARCFEKKPEISESHAHRITCLSYWDLIKANEKI